MKNEQTIVIIKDIANRHTTPAEQRAIEKAIAALQYCGNLTYYTETKRFSDKPDMREKVREYIDELDTEIKRCESELIFINSSYTQSYEPKNPQVGEVWIGHSDNKYELQSRINALIEVKNDLLGRLEEVI